MFARPLYPQREFGHVECFTRTRRRDQRPKRCDYAADPACKWFDLSLLYTLAGKVSTTRSRPATVTDFLEDKRLQITARLKELKPLVDEFGRLEAAAEALAGISGASGATTSVAPRRRGPGRPRRSKTAAKAGRPRGSTTSAAPKARAKPAGKRVAGRRKGSGKRGGEALALIQKQPGITIPELATKMGIKQNYLYRVLPALEQGGKVEKKDRGWHPKDSAS